MSPIYRKRRLNEQFISANRLVLLLELVAFATACFGQTTSGFSP